jgi:hypothetical protein
MFKSRLLTTAILYHNRKQAAEFSIRKNKLAPLQALSIYQGAYVATAFPFAARNTAYERPFIVSTVKLTVAPFMVSELSWPPVV